MTDDRRDQELRRDAARKALEECFPPFAGFPESTITPLLDRLFPLPADPEEERETVVTDLGEYRVSADGKALDRRYPGAAWRSATERLEDLLAVAAMVKRARDRAWVAEHPGRRVMVGDRDEVVAEVLANGNVRFRSADGASETLAVVKPDWIETAFRLLNGSRRTP